MQNSVHKINALNRHYINFIPKITAYPYISFYLNKDEWKSLTSIFQLKKEWWVAAVWNNSTPQVMNVSSHGLRMKQSNLLPCYWEVWLFPTPCENSNHWKSSQNCRFHGSNSNIVRISQNEVLSFVLPYNVPQSISDVQNHLTGSY